MKEIKLTDEQLKNSRRAFNKVKKLPALLSQIIENLQDNMLEREEEFWDELAKLHGYKDFEAVLQDHKILQISWIKGTVELLTKEEHQEEIAKKKKKWPSDD